MSGHLIGLDLGTSFVKASLYAFEGHELVVEREPLSIIYPAPGWVEQNPLEWWLAIQKVLRLINQQIDPKTVQAVGLCAQCPGHVLLGRDNKPIGNAIIWCDKRAVNEAGWLKEQITPEESSTWVGSNQLGDPYCSPARLLWLKNHHGSFNQVEYFLQPKDYIGFMLTGKMATDIHTSFLLAHPVTSKYHPTFLEILGLQADQLPPVLAPTDLLGGISELAAELTGLSESTPVFVGTIDAYCDTLAGGAFIPGQAVDVSGTSEIVSLGVKNRVEGQGVFSVNLGNNVNFLCGPMQAGGSVLNWLANSLYPEINQKNAFAILESEACQVDAGTDGLIFLPYLQGERAPIWDSQVRGAFLGINESHTRHNFSRAVYEGVGFAIHHVLEICENVSGCKADRMIICGGGARSQFWNTIKANILQKTIYPLRVVNSGCLGAAMISAVGMNVYSNFSDAWKRMSNLGEPILPDPCLANLYDESYGIYRRAYPGLQIVFANPSGKGSL